MEVGPSNGLSSEMYDTGDFVVIQIHNRSLSESTLLLVDSQAAVGANLPKAAAIVTSSVNPKNTWNSGAIGVVAIIPLRTPVDATRISSCICVYSFHYRSAS